MNSEWTHDVVVIGGGPAGATAAATLAMKGRRVVLLEKEKFPRYHIGESLIPHCYFTLERLGLIEKMKASHFPKKYSVQFVSPNGKMSQPFYFFQHRDHPSSQTWQVLRSEFDQLLLDNARAKGADVHEETTVKELIRDCEKVVGVRAVGRAGQPLELRAPVTIDATGRDGLAQVRQGWRVRDPYLDKIAIWTYFRSAKRDPGLDEGATTVAYLPHKGWFWYIPLADDVISVGIVAESGYLYRDTRELPEIFCREIGNNVWIKEHLAPGQQFGPYRVTGEFSFRARHCAEQGLVLAGDAFAFLDPVFSSGVFLALRSGEMAADAVDAALTAGDVSAAQFAEYGRQLCYGIESMRRLVYAFYDEAFSFKDLIMKYPNLRGRLTDCLIGDLFTDFDQLFAAVGEFAKVPAPLPHGQPFIAETCASSK
jgi:flavin-dependent dehydrogenase